jgi:N-acetylmuramoyl-L-alanine amidase
MLTTYTTKELDLLARLMRAEAVGDGDLGMLMVGNVGINRVIGDCIDFKDIRSIEDMIYQTPGGFSGKDSPQFYAISTTHEKDLAKRVIRGEDYYPATHALWFYAPTSGAECRGLWFNQANTGRYKNHCFYAPAVGACPKLR